MTANAQPVATSRQPTSRKPIIQAPQPIITKVVKMVKVSPKTPEKRGVCRP
jgi:hypothetical protein